MSRKFPCGHPHSPENISVALVGKAYVSRCRSCKRESARRYRSETPQEERARIYRVKALPGQIAGARAKLARLVEEAKGFGFLDLLTEDELRDYSPTVCAQPKA